MVAFLQTTRSVQMETYFQYGILRLGNTDEDRAHNSAWLGENTLGIEIVKPELAQYCGLGNIDPQHGKINRKSSAIEASLQWLIPQGDVKIVFVRLDQDCICAAAILEERALGNFHNINLDLVARIGAVDRHGWRVADKRYLDKCKNLPFEAESAAIQYFINSSVFTLQEKVLATRGVLVGSLSRSEIEYFAAKLNSERKPRICLTAIEVSKDVGYVVAPGRYREGRNLVNRLFKVGAVFDTAYTGEHGATHRFSIVRKEGCFDRDGCEQAINRAEARAKTERATSKGEPPVTMADLERTLCDWGGNSNIISSPAGRGCETILSQDEVMLIVRAHHESGIISGSLEDEE